MPRAASISLSREQIANLIEQVRVIPYLWNPRDVSYHDAQKVFNAWERISTSLNLECDGKTLKKRWRTLRDTYTRKKEMERQKVDKQRKGKKWEYMRFLDDVPQIDNPSAATNLLQSQEDDEDVAHEDKDNADLDLFDGSTIEVQSMITDSNEHASTSTSAPLGRPLVTPPPITTSHKRGVKRNSGEDLSKSFSEFVQLKKTELANKKPLPQKNPDSTAEDVFLESCKIRVRALPNDIRSV